MTKVFLLDALKAFTEEQVADILMPVRAQKEDGGEKPPDRAAEVYKMRLTKSSAAQKAAPYIIHQIITGNDIKTQGTRQQGRTVVRSIFCVYNEDEQEGSIMLLNLMERLRIALLKQVVIGKQFQLDIETGLETLIYPDDTGSYCAGEMMTTWHLPSVEREVLYGQ